MAWLPTYTYLLAASILLAPTLAAVCPDSCVCSTTRDGLHRVTCSNLLELYKYTLRQKHHNINILDLSHNNITKITHELERLTEVVTLDLSTNGLMEINKFLHNMKKLVHLNLAHNRLQRISLTYLPVSVSSLDLTGNHLTDVPSDLAHLPSLEHLELEGNPLDCSCNNIVSRNRLLAANVYIDDVRCRTPAHLKGRSWLELKTKDICKVSKPDFMDMMMGDEPIDAVRIGEESTALKSMPLIAGSDLEDGKVVHGADLGEDDDSLQFMKVGHFLSSSPNEIEGSGEGEKDKINDSNFEKSVPNINTNDDLIEGSGEGSGFSGSLNLDFKDQTESIPETTTSLIDELSNDSVHKILHSEELLAAHNIHSHDDATEGSGEEGSGFFPLDYDDHTQNAIETTTAIIEDLSPDPVHRIFKDDEETKSTEFEFPVPEPPSVYKGGPDWHSKPDPEVVTEVASPASVTRDTTVSEQIRVTQASEVLGQAPPGEENVVTHKTGTYVCIALIVVLLVGLIGFAITKGQMRKRRDRRLLRQQKRDVEKASKEMVDMNKSLLGKPAAVENSAERKVNGKYELVPTHESHQKKGENGDVTKGTKHEAERTDSPHDTNQNKSSSVDNNLTHQNQVPQQETSFDSEPGITSSRKDTNSLSSEDIFVPANDDENLRPNSNLDLDVSQPLINGDPIVDSDYLSPSREYVPVYSPDMGRVRIKMTETPKPKTPVLVTRSRSNAGDIIITPATDGNASKSTT
ncbi:protein windpipe [Maniola jurtina]|uniref:protein windpipe n=1 Tax=Maniola jurtina TaxID=191418 RepID=UPI001E68933F|nr:protein windpipe [Maniola jurtina]XP_045780932.1 protein windpipe [Maniola jurtina]